jgi:flagella basal body P-ring formation protein FlgA
MSAKRRHNAAHFEALGRPRRATMLPVNKSFQQPSMWRGLALACALVALWLGTGVGVCAQPAASEPWALEVQQLAGQTPLPAGARIEVDMGTLDPRLKLAPCARITPYVPVGTRLWGRARVGLRCDEGARWSVFLPITVKVFAQAWSANQALPAGTVLDASHLRLEEVDLAAEPSPVVRQPQAAFGRALVRGLRAGQALREADLKPRQWFAAGDIVRVVTSGSGFAISADGQALNPGIDGQMVKVRIDGGRVVSGRATAERRIEVTL